MLDLFESEEFVNDVIEIGGYIAGRTGRHVSERVVSAIRYCCELLAEFPGMGMLCDFDSEFPDLRSFTVSRYPNYIIFYRIQSGRLILIRILHGARDIISLFGDHEH